MAEGRVAYPGGMTHAMSTTLVADDRCWQAVLAHDAAADGEFVYAVRTTGVYCRPSCPSRRPKRASVTFFAGPDAAEIAGFRECRRCRPRGGRPMPAGLADVRRACTYIQAHADETLTLARLAADLRREYPEATVSRDQQALTTWVRTLLAHLGGRVAHLDLPIDVQATAFQ